MIEWLVTFVMSWAMFFLLVDKERFKYTVWGGITAVMLQLIVDTTGEKLELYHIVAKFSLFGVTSALFTFGMVFTLGTLFVQFIPNNLWLKIMHIVTTASLFLGIEYLLIQRNLIYHKNWGIIHSWITNILVFITITWIAEKLNIVQKMKAGGS